MHPQKTAKPGDADPNIDANLDNLFKDIAGDFESIKNRVDADMVEQKKKEDDEKKAKDKRVMKKSLNKAYELNGFEKTDVFSQEDGYEFLAQEVGFMKAEELDEEGREVADLCGYQKIAMMLVAQLRAPVR